MCSTSTRSRFWLVNDKALNPDLVKMIKYVGDEYEKARPGLNDQIRACRHGGEQHLSVHDPSVCRAPIKQYGGIDADALRKASLDVDLPEGGTMLGFGVKFERAKATAPRARTNAPTQSSSSMSTTSPNVVWPKNLQARNRYCRCPQPRRSRCAEPRLRSRDDGFRYAQTARARSSIDAHRHGRGRPPQGRRRNFLV
jgi:branched-chain amino acid transport system substrate-binding protein